MEEQPISTVKKIVAAIVALVIIATPMVISKVVAYEYINPKLFAMEIGLTVVFFLALIIYPFSIWKKLMRQPVAWGIKLFLLTLLISTFTSIDRTTSWLGNVDRGTGTFFLLILAIAACAIGIAITPRQSRKYILIPITLSGVVLVISTYAEAMGAKVFVNGGLSGFFGNSSMAGTYLLMTIFITGYLLWSSPSLRAKWLYGIALAAMVLNPIFVNPSGLIGDAKGATASVAFGVVIVLAVWLMVSQKKVQRIIGITLFSVSIAAALIGTVLLVSPQSKVHNWFVAQETDVRFVYWNIALKGFHAHPLLGTGPETYGYTYQTYFDPIVMLKSHSGEIWSNKPHNMYLQVLSETGIIGMIGYLALFIGLIVSLLRLYRTTGDRKLLASMVGLLAGYFINNLIFFDTLTSYFLLFMIMAFIIAATPYGSTSVNATELSLKDKERAEGEQLLRWIMGIIVIVVVPIITIPQLLKVHRAYEEFTLPLSERTTYDQYVENTSSYGSGLFLAQRTDFSFQSVYSPNLGQILQQNAANKTVVVNAIQGTIDTLKESDQRYPMNEQGELAMGRLASIKMVILNAPDAASLATMKAAALNAIALSSTNVNAYVLLGQEYVYEQKYDDAYAAFDTARALEPALAQPHLAMINLANMLRDKKKFDFFVARAKEESPEFMASISS